jgi:hypothetical protein
MPVRRDADNPPTMPKPVDQERQLMRSRHARSDAGFTFVELAFSFLILVIGGVVMVNHLAVNYRATDNERDRVFAYSKAQAILSEIQSFVDRGGIEAAVDLDVLDDGVVNKAPLTIQTDQFGSLVAADHVLSGNYQRDGAWQWSRRISVQPFAGLDNRNVRYVTVRVYKRDRNGNEHPLADLSAVINSAGEAFPTTQVFDVYLLAIENIPGWWVFMDSIKPFVESMITDLENRNPGLDFRTHWITKASFGRNRLYRPYTNDDTDSYASIPGVYHYPGRMPNGNASSYYYVPDNMRARINVDGTERNGFSDGASGTNPFPYALADFFNHGMRLPEERALWQARVDAIEQREAEIAAAIAAGTTPPPQLGDTSKGPTMRLFLEDLYSDPDRYKNALIINLHGELLPMPALRNYSDAARSPVTYPEIRVVTHPEELRTKRDPDASATASVKLRVYAYNTNTTSYESAMGLGAPAVLPDPIAIEVMGVDLRDDADPSRLSVDCELTRVHGGVAGLTDYYGTTTLTHRDDVGSSAEMYYECELVTPLDGSEPFTRIYLFNTPVVCPLDGNGAGLANTTRAQLYQMAYWPCPTVAGPAFNDLTTVGATTPKNTARWILELKPSLLGSSSFIRSDLSTYDPTDDVQLTVRTRIATGYSSGSSDWQSSGTVFPTPIDPDNLSATYTWWADSAEDVPLTERAQFNGDPRHLPYKDCFNLGDDFPNSYNWYHDSLQNTNNAAADVPSLNATYLRNRWASSMSCDVPRYFELLRKALVRGCCVYTSLTGWSYYYMGIGNDIGYDSANGYPNSIPSNMGPHGTTGNGFINTITTARRYVRRGGAGYWWGMPWLGELYPDASASMWLDTATGTTPAVGNLTPGTTSTAFYQSACQSVYAGGGRLAYGTSILNHHQRTANFGCTTFFNIGTSASTFQHSGSSGNGALTAVGNELAANYNMTMPSAAPITRPFRINMASSVAEHWNFPPYSTNRFTGSLYRTYYSHAAGTGSGLIKLVDTGGTSAAYVVVNGISNAVDNGTTFISKYAVLSLVHSFFEAGNSSNTLRIPQLSRVEIDSPTDITELNGPTTIPIQYSIDWTRWDGLPYSQTGAYAEDESQLEYVIMYSRDNGSTWLHVQDEAVATPSERPTDPTHLVADQGTGPDTYDWSVPADDFPEGGYLLRIDCFRQGAQVHFSYHQTKIFIQR